MGSHAGCQALASSGPRKQDIGQNRQGVKHTFPLFTWFLQMLHPSDRQAWMASKATQKNCDTLRQLPVNVGH